MTYTWPLPEGTPVSQHFGANPSNGVNPVGGHTGTDFAVPVGTPVRTIGDGTVKFADWASTLPEDYRADGSGPNPYWLAPNFGGIVVVIDHGPVISIYAHLSDTKLVTGQTVRQGDVIALSGNTGGATTGPHLHFETLPDGWDFQNGTYGRVTPETFCSGYWSGVTPQATTVTPIPEGFLMALTDDEQAEALRILRYVTSPAFKKDIFTGQSDEEKAARNQFIADIFNFQIPWFGFDGQIKTEGRTTTSLGLATGYSDTQAAANHIDAKTFAEAVADAILAKVLTK